MASPSPTADTPPAPAANADAPPSPDGWPAGEPAAPINDLAALRAELDRIDDQIHDLLMARAQVVERVARSGKPSALRPGREAAIIRRLLARHGGKLPPQTLVRMWREMLAGTTGMQGRFLVAICETDAAAGFTQIAREHFGTLTPLRVHRSPAQAMAEVSSGAASVAVLPLPSETETPRDAWWTALLQKDEPRIYVVARLPFWAPRPEGAPTTQALVIAATAPDASGADRSLIGLELNLDISRARLTQGLIAADLAPVGLILRRDPGAQVAHALVEVAGHLSDDDVRLANLAGLLRRPVVLGAYAVPIAGAAA